VTQQSFIQFLAWLPALLLGVFVGAKGFKRMDQAQFRKAVLWILILLAVVGLAKGGYDLMMGAA
jgi:uncharacterized membrane protein YfcA